VRTTTIILSAWLSLLVFQTSTPPGQTPDRKAPDLVIRSLAGHDLFDFYCASCHGRDGKGSGHVAPALKTRPPDLTTLSERNGGTFPAAKVEDVIRGGKRASTAAHGSGDMPVWGPIFKGLDTRNEVNEARIENLVKYIESLQTRIKADRLDGIAEQGNRGLLRD
jgi:mono/diheme cytochrome c family protein